MIKTLKERVIESIDFLEEERDELKDKLDKCKWYKILTKNKLKNHLMYVEGSSHSLYGIRNSMEDDQDEI